MVKTSKSGFYSVSSKDFPDEAEFLVEYHRMLKKERIAAPVIAAYEAERRRRIRAEQENVKLAARIRELENGSTSANYH